MRIRISKPALRRKLLLFLAFDDEAIVTPVADSEVEVSFLGSRNEWAQRKELELRLRSWIAANPEIVLVVTDE